MKGISLHQWSFRLFPGRCLSCGLATGNHVDLCLGCREELPYLGAACRRCALPLPFSATCGQCLARSPAFSRTLAAFRYEEPVTGLIQALKYHGDLAAGAVLGALLAEAVARGVKPDKRPDLLVPVPMHWRRRLARGFNQAREVARAATVAMPIPVASTARVKRRRHTPPQEGLGRGRRLRNLRGAFAVAGSLKGVRVAIVDDVMTTGSTARTLAAALIDAGAADVQVWCVARTPLEKSR